MPNFSGNRIRHASWKAIFPHLAMSHSMRGLARSTIRQSGWKSWQAPLRRICHLPTQKPHHALPVLPRLILSRVWLVNFLNCRALWAAITRLPAARTKPFATPLPRIIGRKARPMICQQHPKPWLLRWRIRLTRLSGFLALMPNQPAQKIRLRFAVRPWALSALLLMDS